MQQQQQQQQLHCPKDMSSSPADGICVLRELPCQHRNTIHDFKSEFILPTKDNVIGKEQQRQEFSSPQRLDEMLNNFIGADKRHSWEKSRKRTRASMTAKKLETQMRQYFSSQEQNLAVVENSSICKMLATTCLASGKELEACCHLIASHASCLRQQILYRNIKSELRLNILQESRVFNLDPKDLDINHLNANTNPKTILPTLRQLPAEWYVLQITAEHEHLTEIKHRIQPAEFMYDLKPMHGIHLVVLPTGQNATHPICITLPKPKPVSSYDIRKEIESLLNNNKSDLTAAYNNNEQYWKMRKKQNEQMISAISEVENSWLREWRILFQADYIEHLDLVKDIHNMIDKLIADSSIKEISGRTRWLLKKIATGACYLENYEIEKAVKYVLPTQTKFAKNVILSIVAKTKVMEILKTAKRKPLVLILDECLDHISFESLKLLKHQPVTRFPSLHLAYALYKQHKSTIVDGYKIIKVSKNLGTFVVNPSLDLKKMEIRMKLFIDYWLPKWEGLYGIKPDLNFFKNALTNYNVLMYNGHGSGIQFLRGEEIERMRVLASVLLFGCGSIKLLPVGGRLPAYGISNQYLMGCSPCILGMLWEVTDADIDKMTAEFISSWITSAAKRSWSDVNLSAWSKGVIEFKKDQRNEIKHENDMLVAVSKSKDICRQYMTSAAIIVRGLPIKLVD
ncbi:separin [Trichogramma pretiosum]|uniref:separin n=1 Tax=Trichogramma pretiosum TaxID=7493 RepID=UPI0006C9D2A7|nr:separin [Trichogramma pretiosum]